jgi:hypothetical protein
MIHLVCFLRGKSKNKLFGRGMKNRSNLVFGLAFFIKSLQIAAVLNDFVVE